MDHRGALLGPEESGPGLQDRGVLGVRDCFFWVTVTSTLVGVVGGWGRLSPDCWWVCSMGVLFPLRACFYR